MLPANNQIATNRQPVTRVDITDMVESCSDRVEEDVSCPMTPQPVLSNVEQRIGDRMQLELTLNGARCRSEEHDQGLESQGQEPCAGSRLQYSTPLKFGIDRILVTDTQFIKQAASSTDDTKTSMAFDDTFGMATADSWQVSHGSRFLSLWNKPPTSTIVHPIFDIDQRPSYRHISTPDSAGMGLRLTGSVHADPVLVALQQRYNSRGLVTSHTAPRHSSYSLNNGHHMRPQDTAATGYSLFGANVVGLRVAPNTNNSKKKRSWSRAVFSNLQRKGLEKRFEVQKYVTKPDRRQLAGMLGLTDAQVKVWFQNRRMKWRHQEEAKRSTKDDLTRHHHSTNNCSRSTKSDDVINANTPGSSCSEDEDSSAEETCDVISNGNQCAFTATHLVSPLSCPLTNENSAASSGGNLRKPASIMSVADILDLRKSSLHSLPAEWNK